MVLKVARCGEIFVQGVKRGVYKEVLLTGPLIWMYNRAAIVWGAKQPNVSSAIDAGMWRLITGYEREREGNKKQSIEHTKALNKVVKVSLILHLRSRKMGGNFR